VIDASFPRLQSHCPARAPIQGGNVGLMGAVAEAVGSRLGGEAVIGVIPEALAPREVGGHSFGWQGVEVD
jgi:predicted Rossmann-fold nucleotide-binding protein